MTDDDDLIRRGDALKALLDGQLRALERKRLDTPDELRSAIAALPHDRTALDRIIADTRADVLREAAKVCDKNEHVSGWVSRDAILAKIKGVDYE